MAIEQDLGSNLGKVDEVMTALYDIFDPEIGMSIVDLDLIKNVEIGADGAPTEIKMVLTTPFCPWAGELIQTVKDKTEEVVGPPVKVTLLADRWEPPPGLF
jgi:metal-sulfur cluster biosynthetic enzyme